MIDHTGINVSNFERSKSFYEAVLKTLGYRLRKDFGKAAGFGGNDSGVDADPGGGFWICEGTPSSPRSHIAFRAKSRAEVDTFYRIAIQAGARDNGSPELCPEYHANYYAGFVYDLDGYNIEAVCHVDSL